MLCHWACQGQLSEEMLEEALVGKPLPLHPLLLFLSQVAAPATGKVAVALEWSPSLEEEVMVGFLLATLSIHRLWPPAWASIPSIGPQGHPAASQGGGWEQEEPGLRAGSY